MLNKQRRVKPLFNKAVKGGERVVRRTPRRPIEDVCTGDHACIRLSGCPSLSVKHRRSAEGRSGGGDRPLPASAAVNCGVGSGGAVPVVLPRRHRHHNPTVFDRFVARLRASDDQFPAARRRERRAGSGLVAPLHSPRSRRLHKPFPAVLAMGETGAAAC